MANDAHDSELNLPLRTHDATKLTLILLATIDFAASWLKFWLEPLLLDPRFNDDRTLILLTFDENESHNLNNNVFSVLLGGAVHEGLHGTVDHTYYTHYSAMSTVQANWALGSLGRGDTDPCVHFSYILPVIYSFLLTSRVMSNVYSLVADAVGHTNNDISGSNIPITESSGETPGPLNPNPELQTPFPAPNTSAVGAGGGPVFVG